MAEAAPSPKRKKVELNVDDTFISIESGSGKQYHIDEELIQFSLSIPNKLLFYWNKRSTNNHSYISLVNGKIAGSACKLREGNERLENRLAQEARRITGKITKAVGRRRELLLRKTYHLVVMKTETESFSDVLQQLEDTQTSIVTKNAYIEQLMVDMAELVNKQMDNSTDDSSPLNKGKTVEEVSPRQLRRKLATFKSFAAKALWFSESFGLVPDWVTLHKAKSGSPVKIQLSECQQEDNHATATQLDTEKLYQVLYILDCFAVSDEAYHEIRMCATKAAPSILPPLYKIKGVRQVLNSSMEIERFQGDYPGAFRPLLETLTTELQNVISKSSLDLTTLSPITVKFSGDGARFSRSSNIILLSFSLPEIQDTALSGSGNHTFAALKAEESYEAISSMTEVIASINSLVKHPKVVIDEKSYDLNIMFGGDYKFLLLILGLNQAHSNFACVWCHVHKDLRWDMSVPLRLYETSKKRTLKTIDDCAALPSSKPAKDRLGVQNKPIFRIEPDKMVIDELHLLLRIGDILIRNIVQEMVYCDKLAKGYPDETSRPQNSKLKDLQDCIKTHCKVTFRVWEKRDPNGRSTGSYDWTSLMGTDMKKILFLLPAKFADLLRPEIKESTERLWNDFKSIYKGISRFDPPDADDIHSQAKDWINLFLSLEVECQGFQKKNVTPYMHALVYHVPHMIKVYGNIKKFSGQGVEKNNDIARRNYFSSNLQDPCGEVLKAEGRLEITEKYKRRKRKYVKRNEDYWNATSTSESPQVEDSESSLLN